MVQATTDGDGIRRDVSYASWRSNKPASPGYSQELISDKVDPKFYDDLLGQPNILGEGVDTLFKVY